MIKKTTLQELRKAIDGIDKEIIKLIQKRLKISKAIAIYKQGKQLPIIQKKREEEALNKRSIMAKKMAIDATFIKRLFTLIIAHSRDIQAKTLKKAIAFDKKHKN